jgi:hypothetical protein
MPRDPYHVGRAERDTHQRGVFWQIAKLVSKEMKRKRESTEQVKEVEYGFKTLVPGTQ